MDWKQDPPTLNEDRTEKWNSVSLRNDKNELLGSVMWFYEGGPFYAHAVDLKEPDVIRRIGPHRTLEGSKAAVNDVIEGKLDVSKRAGYNRNE